MPPTHLENWQQPDIIQAALANKRIAVVGMSAKPNRDSHQVGLYMHRQGYDVIPVNPNETKIEELNCYPSLEAIPHPIDVVNVFRESSAVPSIAEASVNIGAKYLWLQFDVISPQGVAIAEAGGIQCVVDLCLKIEHAHYQART